MRRVRLAVALAGLLAGGCAGTRISCNLPAAAIFVDGRRAGYGQVAIDEHRLPYRSQVVVVAPDGRQAHAVITHPYDLKVEFSPRAAGWGANQGAESGWNGGNGWNGPAANDPWLRPPAGWTPRP